MMGTQRRWLAGVFGVLWLASGQVQAAAGLILGDGSGKPTETVEIPLNLDFDEPLSAVQADIYYDPALLTQAAVVPTPPAGTVLESRLLSPGHLRFVFYSLACTGYTGTTKAQAPLATLQFVIADDAPAGTTDVELQQAVFAGLGGTAAASSGLTSGKVTIEANATAQALPIPSGTGWGWALLAVLIVSLGAVVVRRHPRQIQLMLAVAAITYLAAGPWPVLAANGFTPGDANGDGTVDSQDAALIADVILERNAPTGDADCNGDGVVDALDIACLVDAICNPAQNDAPTLTPLGDQSALTEQLFQVDADATDPDAGDTLTYSLDQAPAGMTIDSGSGVISWTPATGDSGNHSVVVRVTDADGLFDNEAFTLTVSQPVPGNQAPSLEAITDQTVFAGQPFQVDAQASDPDAGDVLSFSLDQAPAGMTLDSTTGLISWTPQSTDVGTHTIIVRVTDAQALFDTEVFTLTVARATANNQAPSLQAITDQSVREDRLLTLGLLATDPDVGDELKFSLVQAPVGVSIDARTGDLLWAPTSAQVGSHTVTVRVTDPFGAFDEGSFNVSVTKLGEPPALAAIADQATVEGNPLGVTATATDPDLPNDTLTYSLVLAPTGASINPASGQIIWTPGGAQVGGHDFTVQVADSEGLLDFTSFIVTVGATNQAPVANDDVYVARQGETLIVPSQGVLENDTDPNGDPLSAELVSQPSQGALTFNADGSFSYEAGASPNARFDTGIDLTQLTLPIPRVSSTFSDSFLPGRAIDGDLETSWFTANGDVSAFYELVFQSPVTVREIRYFGNREFPDGFDFTSGIFLLLDGSGNVLWDSGDITLPDPDRDVALNVSALAGTPVANVVTVRFEATGYEASEDDHGFGEIQVFGDGIIRVLSPELEWSWVPTVLPDSNDINASATVCDLNADGTPEAIFGSTVDSGEEGVLRAIRGTDATEVFTVTDPALRVRTTSQVACGNLDGDPQLEIVALHESGAKLLVFERDGTLKLESAAMPVTGRDSPPALANLDMTGDTVPEIIISRGGGMAVFNADGALRWSSDGGVGRVGNGGAGVFAVADIDLDGVPEIVAGNTAYNHDGSIQWISAVPDGPVAVADFDSDPVNQSDFQAEIVVVSSGSVYMLEHHGSIKWGPVEIPGGGNGGPPTIADFDNDGDPEIGVAGNSRYAVFEGDGTLKWAAEIQDFTSSSTGSTVFDFQGDGSAEVVYRGEKWLWVFRGSDGAVLFQTPMSSGTWIEYPVIADVNADGHAEILIGANDFLGDEVQPNFGLHAFGSQAWVPARTIWNQYAYHATNVFEDGTIPNVEAVHWLTDGADIVRGNPRPIKTLQLRGDVAVVPFSLGPDFRFTSLLIYLPYLFELGLDYQVLPPQLFGVPEAQRPTFDQLKEFDLVIRHDQGWRWICYEGPVYQQLADAGIPLFMHGDDLAWSATLAGACGEQEMEEVILLDDGGNGSVGSQKIIDISATPHLITAGPFGAVSDVLWKGDFDTATAILPPGATLLATNEDGYDTMIAFEDPLTGYRSVTKNMGASYILGPVAVRDSFVMNERLYKNSIYWLLGGVRAAESDSFDYRISDGTMTDLATVHLDVRPANDEPQFNSEPRTDATVGFTYGYDAEAVDFDAGDVLTFSLLDGPSGMLLVANTGFVRWTPAATGSYDVILQVADSEGFTALQGYTITVVEPVLVPDVLGSTQADAASAISAAGLTTGVVVHVNHPTVPATLVADQSPIGGGAAEPGTKVDLVISLGPGPNDVDNDGDSLTENQGDCDDSNPNVYPGASEVAGDDIDQDCDGADLPLPITSITIEPAVLAMPQGESYDFTAFGFHADGSRELIDQEATWQSSLPAVADVDANGVVQGLTPGTTTVIASFDGQTGGASVRVFAFVADDNDPPTALITSPTENQRLTDLTQIVGTADDANLVRWELDLSPVGARQYQTLAVGNNNVVDGVLGVLDPAAFPDARYDIRLRVFDAGRNASTIIFPLTLDSRQPVAPTDLDNDNDGFTENEGDCQDANAAIYPGAPETAGDGIDQDCDGADARLPIDLVVIQPASLTLRVGETYDLVAHGVYNDGSGFRIDQQATWMSSDSSVASVDSRGLVEAVAAGSATITASFEGKSDSASINVVFVDAGDNAPPTAEITAPVQSGSVISPIEVIGSADDESTLVRWELSLRPVDGGSYTTLATGISPVVDGLLGTLDPTLLINGFYDLRLQVFDAGLNVSTFIITVSVEGRMKVGNFSLNFIDLQVPVSGIPITVARSYDSRDKRKGDFGIGWRLGIESLDLSCNGTLGDNWYVGRSGLAYALVPTSDHICVVRLPNNELEIFDFTPTPDVSAIVPFPFGSIQAGFKARVETEGKLEALGDGTLTTVPQVGFTTLTLTDGSAYSPSRFRYTSADGTAVVFKENGIESVTDTNGNSLTFGANGITHSSGKSITFARDTLGRITSVSDPMGNTQSYAYSSAGDLASHTDTVGNTTHFFYNAEHGLLRVEDPLGRPLTRNEYDTQGRLTSTTGAEGRTIQFQHDLTARQEVLLDSDGAATVFNYDQMGNVLQVRDALGNVTTHTYDAQGNQTSTTNATGGTTTRTFDANSNLLTETDALGNTMVFTYDADNNVTSVTGPRGNTTTRGYDSRGNLIRRTKASGQSETFVYDASGNRIAATNALGETVQAEYNSAGFQTAIIDAKGNRIETTYDANGNPIQRTNRRGLMIARDFDSRNLVTSMTDPAGNTNTFDYNVSGLLQSFSDPQGATVAVQRDGTGRISAFIDARGNRTESGYSADGDLITRTDALGRNTTMDYDAMDRRIRTTLPGGGITEFGYDALGRLTTRTGPRGNVTMLQYDDAGRHVSTTDALGNTTQFAYDVAGNLVQRTDALGNATTFTYDALNRRTRVTHPDGTFETTSYNADGRITSTTDALGRTTSFTYDANGALMQVTDPLGGKTNYAYDAQNNLILQTDANGHTTTFSYDVNGRQITRLSPDGANISQSYNFAGNIVSTTNATGDVNQFAYNANQKIVGKNLFDGSAQTFSYTPTNQLDTVTLAAGITDYSYDALDRIAGVTLADGAEIDYTYDSAGNLASMTTQTSAAGAPRTVSYTYDPLNRLATVTDATGGTTSYQYDANGNLSAQFNPNNTSTHYSYDVRNRLVQIEHRNGATVVERYGYTINAVGDRTRVEHLNGSFIIYAYDALRRLTQVTHHDTGGTVVRDISFTYDPVGNRLTRTDELTGVTTNYNYDAADKLLAGGNAVYAYDANGNLVSRSDNSGLTRYAYNPRGMLSSVTSPTGTASFEYDHLGNRVGTTNSAGDVSHLVSIVNPTGIAQVLDEYDNSGTRLAAYVYGHDLLSQQRTGVLSYYQYDATGSTRLLTAATGAVTDTYLYAAFGELLATTGNTGNRYRFSGEVFDELSGFTYLRARYYDPAQGRFITRDPFGGSTREPVSLHRYLYANANPITFTDPSGKFSLPSLAISMATVDTIQTSYNALLFNTFRESVKIASSTIRIGAKGRQIALDAVLIGSLTETALELYVDSNRLISNGLKQIGASIAKEYVKFGFSILPKVELKIGSLRWNFNGIAADVSVDGAKKTFTKTSTYIPEIKEFGKLSKGMKCLANITDEFVAASRSKSGADIKSIAADKGSECAFSFIN